MADLRVARWKKYGSDRLYVKDAEDAAVGWEDLTTGERALVRPGLAPEFRAALAEWRAAHAPELPGAALPTAGARPSPADPSPRAPAPSAASRGRDLSRNRAAKDKVGPALEKLARHGWRVLHSVPLGSRESDIGHVLIGPGGVFTVYTRDHQGSRVWVASQRILVDGQPVPYLRDARYEGQRAARLLTAALGRAVPVRPALVFVTGGGEASIDFLQQPDDVLVLDARDLPGAFAGRTGVLGADAVSAVFEVARWEGTWVL